MNLFSVTLPASDLALLTFEELEEAVGGVAADGSQDDALEAIGLRAAASLASAMMVRRYSYLPVTILRETCSETFWPGHGNLYLSRRPVQSIASVTSDGSALTTDDFTFDPTSGALLWINSGTITSWCSPKIVVVYDAGFDDLPDELKLAATKVVQTLWSESTREPGLKRVKVEGVDEREYWVAPTTDSLIPAEVMDLIRPFMAAPAL